MTLTELSKSTAAQFAQAYGHAPRWLAAGDVVTVTIEQIGALTNPVAEEPCA